MTRTSLAALIASTTVEGKADLVDTPELIVRSREFAAGQGFARHTHTRFDEIFIGITGWTTVVIGNDRHVLGPNDTTIAPRGVEHEVINETASACRIVVVKSPGDDTDVFWGLDR
jgi:quercetin dioxygenase-like cupin family protein